MNRRYTFLLIFISIFLFGWLGEWKSEWKGRWKGKWKIQEENGKWLCGDPESPPYPPYNGDTLYVATDGNDSRTRNQAKNYDTPWLTIQKAIDESDAGDFIIVQDGIYQDSSKYNSLACIEWDNGAADNWIILKAENLHGAKLNGEDMSRYYGIILGSVAYWFIEGFEIDSFQVSGIHFEANVHDIYMYHNKIHDICRDTIDTEYGRPGIFTKRDCYDVTIDGNIIYNIGRKPLARLDGPWSHNYKHDHGIYSQGYKNTIINNIIYDCPAGWGIKVDGNDSSQVGYTHIIANNTFASINLSNPQRPGHIRFVKSGDCTYYPRAFMSNNLFYDPPVIDSCRHAIDMTINYKMVIINCLTNRDSIIETPAQSFDSVEVIHCHTNYNPYFVNAGAFNFHLTDSSYCIDRGIIDSTPGYDMDMYSRPVGDTIDIGAYEYCGTDPQGYPPEAPLLLYPPDDTVFTDTLTYFDWTDAVSADKYWMQVDSNISFPAPLMEDSTLIVSIDTTESAWDEDTYYWRARAKNEIGWSSWSNIDNFQISFFVAAPKYEGFEEGKAGSNVTDVYVNTPTGTALNDLLVAFHTSHSQETHDADAAWTIIDESHQYTSNVTVSLYYKIATASEPDSFLFTSGTGEQHYAYILRISNANTSNPIDAWTYRESSSSTVYCPDATATVDSVMVLRLFGTDDDDINVDSGYPSGHTGITVDKSNEGAGTCSGGAAYEKQNAGAVGGGYGGPVYFTVTASEEHVAYTVIIKP